MKLKLTYKCVNWLDNNNKQSPILICDLEQVKKNFLLLKKNFLGIKPYYAVKANPHKKIINTLEGLGSYFDCASINEVSLCIKNNVKPNKISFGNTIKKNIDIKKAYKLGVNLFAFDAKIELEKLANNAPGANVFCRIQVPNGGAQWPLSNKFGCSPSIVEELTIYAKQLNLKPIGISFHVGSQQKYKTTWEKAIKISSEVFKNIEKKKINFNFLNIGGGIPSRYDERISDISKYGNFIKKAIAKYYGNKIPKKIICEPGRFLVADSAIIESEVILVSKHNANDKKKWVYIDVGRYNGLAETEGEAIRYPITVKGYDNKKMSNFILAGPSCDSHDILYKKKRCLLPKKIQVGDKIRIHGTGAYTITYGSAFNGIKKIKQFFID